MQNLDPSTGYHGLHGCGQCPLPPPTLYPSPLQAMGDASRYSPQVQPASPVAGIRLNTLILVVRRAATASLYYDGLPLALASPSLMLERPVFSPSITISTSRHGKGSGGQRADRRRRRRARVAGAVGQRHVRSAPGRGARARRLEVLVCARRGREGARDGELRAPASDWAPLCTVGGVAASRP